MPISEEPQGKVSVALYITSQALTPSQISEQLGLQPTWADLKGTEMVDPPQVRELLPPGFPTARLPWHLFALELNRQHYEHSPSATGELFVALLDELLQKVEQVAGRLNTLRDRVSAGLECMYAFRHKTESFTLPKTLLRRIAALDLSLQVVLVPIGREEETSDEA